MRTNIVTKIARFNVLNRRTISNNTIIIEEMKGPKKITQKVLKKMQIYQTLIHSSVLKGEKVISQSEHYLFTKTMHFLARGYTCCINNSIECLPSFFEGRAESNLKEIFSFKLSAAYDNCISCNCFFVIASES